MNLTELRTFLAIIETGSLARAAARLNVTQSTVTTRLKTLEAEVGQTLVHRQKSGASLTAAGVRLHRYASTISELWRQARQEIALPDAFDAVCNLACHPDLWPDLGKRMFDHIRAHHPGVALSVWHGSRADMEGWLADGLADLALTYWPSASQKQRVTELCADRLVLVSTRAGAPIRFDPTYVFVEAGEAFGRDHAAAYADAGTARISFGSAVLGLAHLLEHGGSAYLPLRIAKPHLAAGRLHRLEGAPEFQRKSFIVANASAISVWPWFDATCRAVLDQTAA